MNNESELLSETQRDTISAAVNKTRRNEFAVQQQHSTFLYSIVFDRLYQLR